MPKMTFRFCRYETLTGRFDAAFREVKKEGKGKGSRVEHFGNTVHDRCCQVGGRHGDRLSALRGAALLGEDRALTMDDRHRKRAIHAIS